MKWFYETELLFSEWVGHKKSKKCADVLYGWSLQDIILLRLCLHILAWKNFLVALCTRTISEMRANLKEKGFLWWVLWFYFIFGIKVCIILRRKQKCMNFKGTLVNLESISEQPWLKWRHCEKATKFDKISLLFWRLP